MDIEAVAEEDPQAIKTLSMPLRAEMSEQDALKIVDDLELTGKTRTQGAQQLRNLYNMFVKVDAT